ncbi:MAG: Cna B-type domain-containing protein [Oscillospiraceae bacterium]|nr:Cna B-type domain-containing protein [Oscillospiraceae bacterium]
MRRVFSIILALALLLTAVVGVADVKAEEKDDLCVVEDINEGEIQEGLVSPTDNMLDEDETEVSEENTDPITETDAVSEEDPAGDPEPQVPEKIVETESDALHAESVHEEISADEAGTNVCDTEIPIEEVTAYGETPWLFTAGSRGGADASSYFHTTISTNRDTYTSGETAQVSIRYRIDQGMVSPGDYVIVSIPEDISSGATFSVSKQHFSSVEDLGNGQYKLTFGEDAATGLSGSMTVRVLTQASEETTDTISAGDGEKKITVLPGGTGESGVGDYSNEAIMKDCLGNDGMSFGGYDYSGDNSTQIGLFDSSDDHDFTYRLFINRKNVSMTNVTVSDTLPDGMIFNGLDTVVCHKMDGSTMTTTDEVISTAQVSFSEKTLTVFLGDIDYPVEVSYSVHVPAQTSVFLRNHSEVTYTQDGSTYKEGKDYIAQGEDYSASNGVKSVDKTIISDDPSDQWVTYTIRFWNENRFEPGEISLVDDLDDYVTYLYSDDNEYFELTVDEDDPTVLYITNVKAIPASTEVYETFVCDFSGVPVGHTVYNSTGGNTTRTKKVKASLEIAASKTVDGEVPEQEEVFSFQLLDADRKVIQTSESTANGEVRFETIKYGKEDLGKTFVYYVSEVIPDDSDYIYDTSEYKISASLGMTAGEDGIIPIIVKITKEGKEQETIVFNNEKVVVEKITISGKKTWDDAEDQDRIRPESIVVDLYADGTKVDSRTVTQEDDWAWEFSDLDKYDGEREIVYTIGEEAVEGYQESIEGYDITNTHVPSKVQVPVRKVWEESDNKDKLRPDQITVTLYANGKPTDHKAVLSEENQWTGSFKDLDEYSDGNKIVYTVVEEPVEGYTSKTSGNAEEGYVITNMHEPEPEETPTPPTPGGTVPNTGDPTECRLWLAMMILSGTLLMICLKEKERKHR